MAKKKEKQINLYKVIFGIYWEGEYSGDDDFLNVLAETGEKAIEKAKKDYVIKKNEFIDEVKLIETDVRV